MYVMASKKSAGSAAGRARLMGYALITLASLVTLAACNDDSPAAPSALASQWDKDGRPRDRSPHREGYVRNGAVALHYLDWGGSGPPLVLLPGLGDNAHVYDDFAPDLTPRYHVIAITPRGFGQSDKPATGYEPDSMANDVLAVLDYLKLPRVYLAGHSLSAYTVTRLSARNPERVMRAVYIDGSIHDRTVECGDGAGEGGGGDSGPIPGEEVQNAPPATEADLVSFQAYARYEARNSVGPFTPARVNNLWHAVITDAEGHVVGYSTEGAVYGALLHAACNYRHEFSKMPMPALAIAARNGTIYDLYPWLPADVSGDSLAFAQLVLGYFNNVQGPADLAAFVAEAPQGRGLAVENSTHYIFFKNEREVQAAMREFLPGKH